MFSLFKKRKQLHIRDSVWMTVEAKYSNLIVQLAKEVNSGGACVILPYFEQCREEVKSALKAVNLAYADGETPERNTSILLCPVLDATENIELPNCLGQLGRSDLTFVFPEHFPAYCYEQKLLETLLRLYPKARGVFFSSLDEPFMWCFDSERFKGLVESLRADSSQTMDHAILSMSITDAQKKIQASIDEVHLTAASSQQEWLRRNLKE